MKSQSARIDQTINQEIAFARLRTAFALLALVIGCVGLYGTMSYNVARRTSEIGIRMALGAQAGQVLRLVIWQGMKLVLLGLAVGALGGYAFNRSLASQYFEKTSWQTQMAEQLYGVKGTDPVTFTLIVSLLALVALVACLLPARRATKVDPMVALKYE